MAFNYMPMSGVHDKAGTSHMMAERCRRAKQKECPPHKIR
jgi:hypothetical protein